MGINGKKRVTKMFTIPVMIKTMEEYYKEVIKK